MDLHDFLRWVKLELGMSNRDLAAAIGVSASSIDRWSALAGSRRRTPMVLFNVQLILKLLAVHKRKLIARGDRIGAETVYAIGTQVDPARFAKCMRKFDVLQRGSRMVGIEPRSSAA